MPFNKVKATILVFKSKRKPDVDAIAFFGRTPQDFNDDIKKCAAEIQGKWRGWWQTSWRGRRGVFPFLRPAVS